jgi:hypothetical protein
MTTTTSADPIDRLNDLDQAARTRALALGVARAACGRDPLADDLVKVAAYVETGAVLWAVEGEVTSPAEQLTSEGVADIEAKADRFAAYADRLGVALNTVGNLVGASDDSDPAEVVSAVRVMVGDRERLKAQVRRLLDRDPVGPATEADRPDPFAETASSLPTAPAPETARPRGYGAE